MAPGVAIDLELARAAALLESDPAAAAAQASALLEHNPGHETAQLLLAAACRNLGDSERSLALLAPLAGAQPDSVTLQLELGRACVAAGRSAEAIDAFVAAVALDDRIADAWYELAALAVEEGRLDQASDLLQQRLLRAVDDVAALRMCALVARARGRYAEAEHYLRRCLELEPGFAVARFDLATELCVQQRYAEAGPHLERLLVAAPSHSGYICLQAQLLRFNGHNDEAGTLLERALAINPGDAMLHLHYGLLLRDQGDQPRAIDAYRRSLAIDPGMTEAYRSLADLKTVRFTAADREAMQRLVDGTPAGPNRIHVEFALGKAWEDEAQHAQAFKHYARGNALVRATLRHDPEAMTAGVQRSKALYSPVFFADRTGWGSERKDPIFIVGMPRSGSTLLEQILASHSQVEGTRELPNIPAIAREVLMRKNPDGVLNYPDPVGRLTRAEVSDYATRYLEEAAPHRPLGKPRFVDKMLVNFDHIGLIHLMFPRATIIDARRHPLACCFSCFRQLFGRGHPFSYDQRDIGRHYRDYFELMEHIDAVLPGRVHRVNYEQLVRGPEDVIRRLLDHCGLPFEAECLQFHANRRVVTTISSEQVRRPISLDAVDQWRQFEPWLGELKDALGDLVGWYPTC